MITTFYTERRETDRSAVLASVAQQLADWGYRVLCVDWNLTSPGVTPRLVAGPPAVGLLDLVAELGEPAEYVVPVRPGLDLLAATAGEAVDWAGSYRTRQLGDFLESCAEDWRSRYDAVLIDAPAGHGPAAGICVAQLPDALVLVIPPDGGATGADLVARAAAARDRLPYDRPRLLVLPCLTGVAGRPEALELRFAGVLDDWADQDVPVERLVEALSLDSPASTLAALIAAELQGTGLLRTEESTAAYVARAAAGPGGGAAPTDPLAGVRLMATDALDAVLVGILAPAEWSRIERGVLALSDALDAADAAAVGVSAADLAGLNLRSGGVRDRSAIPPELRALVERVLRRLRPDGKS